MSDHVVSTSTKPVVQEDSLTTADVVDMLGRVLPDFIELQCDEQRNLFSLLCRVCDEPLCDSTSQ